MGFFSVLTGSRFNTVRIWSLGQRFSLTHAGSFAIFTANYATAHLLYLQFLYLRHKFPGSRYLTTSRSLFGNGVASINSSSSYARSNTARGRFSRLSAAYTPSNWCPEAPSSSNQRNTYNRLAHPQWRCTQQRN